MIRVLHVIDSLDLGGAQTVVLNLARHRDQGRFQLEVATMHGRGVFAEPLEQEGIAVHSLSPQKWLPCYFANLPGLLRRGRFQIIHCHLFASNWIAKPLAGILGAPVRIAHDHCNDAARAARPAAVWFDRITNNWSNRILAVSQSTRDFLVRREHLDPARVEVLHNGVDTTEFRPPNDTERRAARAKLRIPEDARFIIGGVGRLTPQKNFTDFLRVAAAVLKTHPKAFFVIAGTGPEEQHLKALAASLGINERIRFAGFVEDRPALYHALDALLLTSNYEGLPMTILEAMASGAPIAASGVDGVAEILEDGRDALLCAPGDISGFAEAAGRLMDANGAAFASAALEKVRARFDARRQVLRLEEIYVRELEIATQRMDGA